MASWVSSAISTIASHAGSAVSAVAGCTASAVVEKIVEVGMSFLSKHMLSDNSEAVLTRVQMALPQIRAVMGVAEALKVKDPGSSEWVEQFRQAVDAAEDVLDELEYKKLEDMVKHRDEAEEPASGSKKRKTCTTSISDDILERLKKAITMLDQVAATVERLLQLAIALGISSPLDSQLDFRKDLRRESTSLVAEREVFGREIEKEKIINWLKQPTRARLSSFGIVGVGGIGKTTLAQFAYQEMRKSDYFEKMIWVSVSTDFSVEDITIKILSKLGESGCEFVGASNESFYSGIEKARMANLVNLRYMRLPYRIKKTICGVHWMTSLQELTFFVGNESGYRINELSTLNNLTRLTIYNTENIGDPAEAKAANILGKKSLRSLSLTWTSKSKLNKAEKIIDNLLPHPNLLELKIENYKGQRSPTWMSNTPPLNLSSLKLYRCRYLNKQPIFGQLPHLKVLHIYECPNLDKLPDMPISLTEFRIIDVGLTSLPYLYQSFGTKSLEPLSLKSSLRAVRIMQCRNLKSLNGFLQQGTLDLQGFEELTIGSCRNLAQLSINGFKTFVSLKYLCIGDCPNVTRLPCLPRCLITFEIYNMAIRSLPEYFGSPSLSSGPSTSLLESSLREVYITKCRNITALNGFLQQENIDFQSINKIYIKKCEQLAQIPTGAFQKFVSLVDLTIEKCPKLMAVDNKNNLLPSKLKRLSMMNCGELDVPLLESASILTTVTDLIIGDCANITRIPSSENVFGSLCKLSISGCGKLIAPPFTQQAHNFDQGSNCSSFIINDLFIGHLSFLLIEPLRSLKSVSVLQVGDCSGMEALPEQWLLQNSSCLRRLLILNASTLQSLPANMSRLAALEELRIENADFLVELPELPASLKNKCIYGSGNRRL
ncbi:hypothetical protein LUZ63_013040 [Rhynchospora breviuscula]|uniref:Uncharacterized protein n=1 Tax=Rhynchospora breviuscula TaxID=2022672 RepID=A0A9Q0C7U3_9POAL|nr:hypothetical protein LUZ63_013040 [Rhynchospora breviuscula]